MCSHLSVHDGNNTWDAHRWIIRYVTGRRYIDVNILKKLSIHTLTCLTCTISMKRQVTMAVTSGLLNWYPLIKPVITTDMRIGLDKDDRLTGCRLNIQICHLTSIGYPIVEIRRSYNRLISIKLFPTVVRRHVHIESKPRMIGTTMCNETTLFEICGSKRADPVLCDLGEITWDNAVRRDINWIQNEANGNDWWNISPVRKKSCDLIVPIFMHQFGNFKTLYTKTLPYKRNTKFLPDDYVYLTHIFCSFSVNNEPASCITMTTKISLHQGPFN